MRKSNNTNRLKHCISFSSLVIFFCFSLNSVGASKSIKADEVFNIEANQYFLKNAKILAWSYDCCVYFLDKNLNLNNKLEIKNVSLSNVVKIKNRLYIQATRQNKVGEIESLIVEFDLITGLEKKRWFDPKYYIWSISVEDDYLVAMSSEGNKLLLGNEGFNVVAKYPAKSHYYAVKAKDPIVCTAANLTKRNWTLASCAKISKNGWVKEGRWNNITPPFLCNGYLIEKYNQSKGESGAIVVSETVNGKVVGQLKSNKKSNVKCVGKKIVYSSNSTINILELPSLKNKKTIKTDSDVIISATKMGTSYYWVDQSKMIQTKTVD